MIYLNDRPSNSLHVRNATLVRIVHDIARHTHHVTSSYYYVTTEETPCPKSEPAL